MAKESKRFHIGDILSVTHDRLLSPRHIEGVYDIMQHLFGRPIWTDQLVVLHDEAKRELLRQHPQLVEINVSSVSASNWQEWLKKISAKYGETHLVSPIHNAELRDPISDLEGIVGKDKVIAIKP